MPKLSNFPDLLSKKPRGTYVTSSLFDGERRIVSYRVVGGYPLVIAAALGWDALLANWWRAADAALFCFAVVAVLVLATTTVVIERQRARRDAMRRAFALERLRTIGQMTGGIAHDFNNVIAAVGAGDRESTRLNSRH